MTLQTISWFKRGDCLQRYKCKIVYLLSYVLCLLIELFLQENRDFF